MAVRSVVLAVVLVGGSSALGACAGPGRREANALADAVDRYRRADEGSKEAAGKAVAAVECTDAKVCDAKQACLAAIEPTTRSIALKNEVTRMLGEIEAKRLAPDAPEAAALPGKLDEAERLLRDGRAGMARCDASLTDLRVAFGA